MCNLNTCTLQNGTNCLASLTNKTPLVPAVVNLASSCTKGSWATNSLGLELGRLFRLEVRLVPENLSVKVAGPRKRPE